jgi:hypothetical protein
MNSVDPELDPANVALVLAECEQYLAAAEQLAARVRLSSDDQPRDHTAVIAECYEILTQVREVRRLLATLNGESSTY